MICVMLIFYSNRSISAMVVVMAVAVVVMALVVFVLAVLYINTFIRSIYI